jgi:hypothetical protein
MIEQYNADPSINFAVCRKRVQPHIPELYLTDGDIRIRCKEGDISEYEIRFALCKRAMSFKKAITDAINGNLERLSEAEALFANGVLGGERPHRSQAKFILNSTLGIDELFDSKTRTAVQSFGNGYQIKTVRRLIELIRAAYSEKKLGAEENISAEGAVSITAADEFFTALNRNEYGNLIDSAVSLCDCTALDGIEAARPLTVLCQNLLRFISDQNVTPILRHKPGHTVALPIESIHGSTFLPSPERTSDISDAKTVKVRIISPGWKRESLVISPPVLQEMDSNFKGI